MEQDHNVHLKWNMHKDTLTSVFTTLLESEKLVDCIVSAEGQCLNVHKIVLSACSPYFELLFSQHYERYPIIILPDIKFEVLKSIIYFMYCGEMSVQKDDLDMLLRIADFLQVKGLSTTINIDTRRNLVSERKIDTSRRTHSMSSQPVLQSVFSSDFNGEQQRVKVKKISEDNPLRPHFPKKKCTAVSADHRQKKSDQCSVSGYKTHGGSLTMKEGNTCMPGSSCSSTGLTVVKTEPHDDISEICSNPCSPSSACSYTQTLVKVADNEPVVSKRKFPTPVSPVPMEEAVSVDEDVFDPGVPAVVPQEPKCEDFEDDMEIIALDDQSESGSGVREKEKMPSKQRFPNTQSPSCELQFGRPEGGSAFVQEGTPPAHSQSSPCKCQLCGRLYRHYSSLRRHIKFECGKEPQFKCLHCQSRYTQKCHLRLHMIKQHQIY